MPTLEPWPVLANVADLLQAGEDTVLRRIASRQFPAHHVEQIWCFKLTGVDGWVRTNESQPSENVTAKRIQTDRKRPTGTPAPYAKHPDHVNDGLASHPQNLTCLLRGFVQEN